MPARDAKVPIVDRIFARVGASDNIARGQSTFMVEMQETANILHTATSRSLVVLDEIGRGTSTFDGLSIAWAVAEYLATNPKARPKTLFATHYHELTDLADALPGVVNAHVAAREWKDDIIFLRKIVPGRSDRSYGIQVARLAGLPPAVVARAKEILTGLERDELSRGGRPDALGHAGDRRRDQLGLFAGAPATADPRDCRTIARAAAQHRPRRHHAAAGAGAAGRAEEAGGPSECTMHDAHASLRVWSRCCVAALHCVAGGCRARSRRPIRTSSPSRSASAPNNLDPRKANDEGSQRVGQLVFSSLMDIGRRPARRARSWPSGSTTPIRSPTSRTCAAA